MNDLFIPTEAALENITIEDCIDMKEKKNWAVVIADGEAIGFVKEG